MVYLFAGWFCKQYTLERSWWTPPSVKGGTGFGSKDIRRELLWGWTSLLHHKAFLGPSPYAPRTIICPHDVLLHLWYPSHITLSISPGTPQPYVHLSAAVTQSCSHWLSSIPTVVSPPEPSSWAPSVTEGTDLLLSYTGPDPDFSLFLIPYI